jgi:hypothetical protein
MSILTALPAIIGFLPNIFRKKPFQLWYWNSQKWETKGGPMSSRQCHRQKAALVSIGMDETRFVILRKGVEPPPFGPQGGKP